jgi:hypothetical protein
MKDYLFIIITVLAFLIALIIDLLKRDKESINSPRGFDPSFYWKDNKVRLVLSFSLSFLMAIITWLLTEDIAKVASKQWTELNLIVYAIIGAAPDLVIGYAKRNLSFLQPKETEGYKRVQESK